MEDRQTVVVVGGGAAGTLICRQLSKKLSPTRYNLILVTARAYYTHLLACIRMTVTSAGNLEDRAQIQYDHLFQAVNPGRVIIGKVSRIEDEKEKGGNIVLETGERVTYSVLVLTPGSTWEGPLDFPDSKGEAAAWLESWRERFRMAEDIVIVGGGAVGIEFAGEIRDLSPTKRITTVHRDSLLLNDAYPDSFRKATATSLRNRNVEVILQDSINDLEISAGGTVRTSNGRLLVADLVIPCRGPRPNTDFTTSLGPDTVDNMGYVLVLVNLQLLKHPRIFAAGDIINWDEQKQMSKYAAHAKVVVENVMAVLKGEQPEGIYRGCYERITISNGKDGGTMYYSSCGPELQFGDWVSSVTRSKSLGVGAARRKLGMTS